MSQMNLTGKFTIQTWPERPEIATQEGRNKLVGLWLFLAGESVLFATLFATYLALKNRVPDSSHALTQDLYSLPLVFVMTAVLLTSSLTSVYAIHHMRNFNFKGTQLWFAITVLLGLTFLALEIYEFYHYTVEFGHTFRSSAFGSAYYFLVGTHGAHVCFGLGWITALLIRNAKRGLNLYNAPKYYMASLYWHFIDVVWVFIFSVVYLMGMV